VIEIGKEHDSEKPPLYSYHIMGIPDGMLKAYDEVLKKTTEMILILEKELN
jgi:hypothetical protein